MPPQPPSSVPSGSDSVHDRDRRRPEGRRVLVVSLLVSLVLHLLAILLYPVLLGPGSAGGPGDPQRIVTEEPAGIEVLRMAVVPEEALERPSRPDPDSDPIPELPRPTESRATDADPTPGDAEPGAGVAEDASEGMGAADRIRSTHADARLVIPLPEDVAGLSQEQIAQLELAWALEELNDSAAAAAMAASRATDWTFTDGDGNRWGFSPGKIHLGGLTLPMPSFGAPYDPNAWKGSMAADLERAAGSAAARQTQEERAKAIRERRDRERRERADSTGNGGRR